MMQRLRVKFSRGEEIQYISHLDIMRLWQRAFNRAGIALAYSEGFNPRPRMSLAAPLALGITSEAELMDVVLSRWSAPHSFEAAMGRQLPRGVAIQQVMAVDMTLPSLQSQVQYAEYLVTVIAEKSREETTADIDALLARDSIPWEHQRDTGPRRYDLRPLIDDLWLTDSFRDDVHCLGMRLRCSSNGSGRPEQVAAALGITGYPVAIHRSRLILSAK